MKRTSISLIFAVVLLVLTSCDSKPSSTTESVNLEEVAEAYFDDSGSPIYFTDDGEPLYFNVHGEGVYLDNDGRPMVQLDDMYYTKDGRPVTFDIDGVPTFHKTDAEIAAEEEAAKAAEAKAWEELKEKEKGRALRKTRGLYDWTTKDFNIKYVDALGVSFHAVRVGNSLYLAKSQKADKGMTSLAVSLYAVKNGTMKGYFGSFLSVTGPKGTVTAPVKEFKMVDESNDSLDATFFEEHLDLHMFAPQRLKGWDYDKGDEYDVIGEKKDRDVSQEKTHLKREAVEYLGRKCEKWTMTYSVESDKAIESIFGVNIAEAVMKDLNQSISMSGDGYKPGTFVPTMKEPNVFIIDIETGALMEFSNPTIGTVHKINSFCTKASLADIPEEYRKYM